MHQAVVMQVLQSEQGLMDNVHRLIHSKAPALVQCSLQSLARQVLHGQVVQTVLLPGFESSHDVGMLQALGQLCFPLKPSQDLGVPGLGGRQHLERYQLAQPVDGLVNHCQASPANAFQQLVGA